MKKNVFSMDECKFRFSEFEFDSSSVNQMLAAGVSPFFKTSVEPAIVVTFSFEQAKVFLPLFKSKDFQTKLFEKFNANHLVIQVDCDDEQQAELIS